MQALSIVGDRPYPEARLEEGIVRRAVGDLDGARRAFEIASSAGGAAPSVVFAARLGLAGLDAGAGRPRSGEFGL